MGLFGFISKTKRRVADEISKHINVDECPEGENALPTTLNLMVTDTCNSRCVMCNIWNRKQEKEFTPTQLAEILRDPLFNNLRHIGVSGGEPTLRDDLSDIFRVITGKKGIKGVSLITNALNADRVISQIDTCYLICKEARVPFDLMISLDGIGKVHDMVRGRGGSFESALKVINHFHDKTKIPLSIACTVVKENVWNIDEVLDFCINRNVYARFRIAEFINRLYNADIKKSIRNFDNDERYQIALFFSKLELTYEKDPNVRETYKNIRQMIFEDMPRETGCPYRSVALGLDSRGNLIFCSPKSPLLGSTLSGSALILYREQIGIRQNIFQEYCKNCIHDYHAPPTRESLETAKEEAHFKAIFSVKKVLEDSVQISSATPKEPDWSHFMAPLLIGWYGTETAGDKAILGTIIRKLQEVNGNSRITIASLYPFVTKRTLYELGVDAKIVKTHSQEYLNACKNADAVIMGGGPLMGMEPLGFVLKAFLTAKQFNIPTILEGCGIGPLSEKKYVSAVKEILRLSSNIKVRDMASLAWVIENTGRNDAVCSGDSAVTFVEQWKNENLLDLRVPVNGYLTCFLRELTTEYANGMSLDDFLRLKKSFEEELSKMLIYLKEKTGLKLLFMPMHTFVVGNDDRDFIRRFVRVYFKDHDYEVGYKVYSPNEILSVMSRSRFNLCMRFHSVLFADTIGVPFVAIDYTGGGKIKGYLKDRKKEELKIDRVDIAEGRWKKAVDYAILNISH